MHDLYWCTLNVGVSSILLTGSIHAYVHMVIQVVLHRQGLWPRGVHHLTFDPVFTNEEVCDYSARNHSEPGAQALCKGVVCVKWSVYLLLWPQSGQVGLVPSSVWRGLEKQRAEAWVFGLGRRAGCLGDAEGKQQDLAGALWSQSLVRPEERFTLLLPYWPEFKVKALK